MWGFIRDVLRCTIIVLVSAFGTHACLFDVEPSSSCASGCPTGQVCGTVCGGTPTCIPLGCSCENQAGNPMPSAGCYPYVPPRCTCDNATCDNPLDSCGEQTCPGVCELGDSCQFCVDNEMCNGEPCRGGLCLLARTGLATCRPTECAFSQLMPPLCGSPDALCGEECCLPDCEGFQCGQDRLCGVSCGTCAPHHSCVGNQCTQSAVYSECSGDLTATPPEIVVEPAAGPMPPPIGGTLEDGIYDLTALREYVHDTFAETFTRAAMRFFNGGTELEHIYDADFLSGSDPEAPHRHVNVTVTGPTTLHFWVICPGTLFPMYDRDYSVHPNELWLYQEGMIEVYTKRPSI